MQEQSFLDPEDNNARKFWSETHVSEVESPAQLMLTGTQVRSGFCACSQDAFVAIIYCYSLDSCIFYSRNRLYHSLVQLFRFRIQRRRQSYLRR